jgi:hypothetical protein
LREIDQLVTPIRAELDDLDEHAALLSSSAAPGQDGGLQDVIAPAGASAAASVAATTRD